MAIFNSYVKLPEGTNLSLDWLKRKFTGQTTVIFMGKSLVQILNDDVNDVANEGPSISCWYFPAGFYGFIEDFSKNYMIIL